MIAQTRAYIQDFAAAYEVATDIEDLVTTMVGKYPHHGNLWSLQFLAASALQYTRNRPDSGGDRAGRRVRSSATSHGITSNHSDGRIND